MFIKKSYDFTIKDFDEMKGIVQFYIVKFNLVDYHGDMFVKDSIEFNPNDLRHFKNHDINQVVGVVKEVAQDDNGYYVTSQLLPTQLGKDTLIEYQYNAINQHSIGGYILKSNYDSEKKANVITQFKLLEVSSLTHWAAQPETNVISLKHRNLQKSLYLEYLKNII